MKRPAFVIAAAVAFALATGSVTSGSSDLAGPGTIKLTTKQVYIDLDNRGETRLGAGDVLVIRELLYNKGITRQAIGRSEMVCTYTSTTWRQCSGTYSLPRGKIVVSGSVRFREFYKLAVVGGT